MFVVGICVSGVMPEEEAPAVEESVVKASDDATAATEDNSPSKEESKPSSPKEPEQRCLILSHSPIKLLHLRHDGGILADLR